MNGSAWEESAKIGKVDPGPGRFRSQAGRDGYGNPSEREPKWKRLLKSQKKCTRKKRGHQRQLQCARGVGDKKKKNGCQREGEIGRKGKWGKSEGGGGGEVGDKIGGWKNERGALRPVGQKESTKEFLARAQNPEPLNNMFKAGSDENKNGS